MVTISGFEDSDDIIISPGGVLHVDVGGGSFCGQVTTGRFPTEEELSHARCCQLCADLQGSPAPGWFKVRARR